MTKIVTSGRLLTVVSLFACALPAAAQAPLMPYHPDREEVAVNYKSAAELDSLVRNKAYRTGVRPRWQSGKNAFWYKNLLQDSTAEYVYVDATAGTRQLAFDHARLAAGLSKATGKPQDAAKLQLTDIVLAKDGILVETDGKWYNCHPGSYEVKPQEIAPERSKESLNPGSRPRWDRGNWESRNISPDKKWKIDIREGNIWLQPNEGGEAVQYTTNGTKAAPYGEVRWAPDSRFFAMCRIYPVEAAKVYYLLSSQPNTTRAELKFNEYAQPGDPNTMYEVYVGDVAAKTVRKAAIDSCNDRPSIRWRKSDNRYFTYERADRGHQRFRIVEVDRETGATRNIVEEKTNTFIYEQRIFTSYLDDKDEIIWSTEKDGYMHLYLVDAKKGGVKNAITKGDWVVRGVDSVDAKKRQVWFRASGMNAGEDPYNVHYYRINFDGKGLVKLTTANGQHSLTFSPDRSFYIDNYSRPDVPPVTELRRTSDGSLVTTIEKADITRLLATGLRLPEVFVAKARDGKTDIWGIVCRPRNFDPQKKYPVIENIYAGPQDAFVPKSFSSYSEMQSMAELGFIVVQMDGMGTANRSKAFHDKCWQNIADAGFPDRILWIKALAAKYPYVDADRVGLYGTSAGGQNTVGGLLFHPEFYKAGVAACGCHDNRVDKQWWNEQWMGYPVGKHYEEQSNITNAAKLQGNLLLIVGEADTNVPPESTYRLADALIKANKDFDFLVVPGMGHSDGGPYGRRKKRDFFVKTLLGAEPPVRNIASN
ncbi:S9 family peptidase [Chitinophaga sedimenti]|uniref:S9 family peptidase n=1 Tax=Chitinophaga sedimenti TaxID=2033606 RepID=UPI0020032CBF|nr:S9 family peptidase [Chitinophaga sedimenti]MCK7554679.1 S9 family peptidase [Chitinophaga sedimenti]